MRTILLTVLLIGFCPWSFAAKMDVSSLSYQGSKVGYDGGGKHFNRGHRDWDDDHDNRDWDDDHDFGKDNRGHRNIKHDLYVWLSKHHGKGKGHWRDRPYCQIDDDDNGGGGPNPTHTPLPASLWLFGSALYGMVGLSRRKG